MTTLLEAIRVRREYDEAYDAMCGAMARFERARRTYNALPLSFQDCDEVRRPRPPSRPSTTQPLTPEGP